jgi:hypothetical protein
VVTLDGAQEAAEEICTTDAAVLNGEVESKRVALLPGMTTMGPTSPTAAYAACGAASRAAPTAPATTPLRIALIRDLDRDMRAPPTVQRTASVVGMGPTGRSHELAALERSVTYSSSAISFSNEPVTGSK